MRILFLVLSLSLWADNEIYVNQSGSNAVINLEQLGSGNLIGGTSAVSGTMTALDLDGTNMTLEINQIGDSNIFRSDAFESDYLTGLFDFQGDSNQMDILTLIRWVIKEALSLMILILVATQSQKLIKQVGSCKILIYLGLSHLRISLIIP